MSNLSELIIRNSSTPDKLHQADAWAKQALDVIKKTKETARGDPKRLSTCEHALAAVLFNLGSLREVRVPPPPSPLLSLSEKPVHGHLTRWRTIAHRHESCSPLDWNSLKPLG